MNPLVVTGKRRQLKHKHFYLTTPWPSNTSNLVIQIKKYIDIKVKHAQNNLLSTAHVITNKPTYALEHFRNENILMGTTSSNEIITTSFFIAHYPSFKVNHRFTILVLLLLLLLWKYRRVIKLPLLFGKNVFKLKGSVHIPKQFHYFNKSTILSLLF